MSNSHEVYLEVGQKKVFACAINWPGWCRHGQDEESAIQALFDAAPRYRRVLDSTDLGFKVPERPLDFSFVERVEGNSTTDFGAPDMLISGDRDPVDSSELQSIQKILRACWLSFDKAVTLAEGKQLRKGPRGGGRDLMGIIDHVLGADTSYLRTLGWKVETLDQEDVDHRLDRIRREIINGLAAAVDGELPERGPRGGKRWPARFFVRRLAWHVVDHAWEIEDRIICSSPGV